MLRWAHGEQADAAHRARAPQGRHRAARIGRLGARAVGPRAARRRAGQRSRGPGRGAVGRRRAVAGGDRLASRARPRAAIWSRSGARAGSLHRPSDRLGAAPRSRSATACRPRPRGLGISLRIVAISCANGADRPRAPLHRWRCNQAHWLSRSLLAWVEKMHTSSSSVARASSSAHFEHGPEVARVGGDGPPELVERHTDGSRGTSAPRGGRG